MASKEDLSEQLKLTQQMNAVVQSMANNLSRIESSYETQIDAVEKLTKTLNDLGRVEYVAITDAEALEAFQLCSRQEGIIPALEPAHALAHVAKIAPTLPRDHLMVMNMCGRGDKVIFAVSDNLGVKL